MEKGKPNTKWAWLKSWYLVKEGSNIIQYFMFYNNVAILDWKGLNLN